MDVYGPYLEKFDNGGELKQINQQLRFERAATFGPPPVLDATDFWFALAQAQWECGVLESDVLQNVSSIIEQGLDLEDWEGDDRVERQQVLEQFLEKIQKRNDQPKQRQPRTKFDPYFKKGQTIAFPLPDGKWGAAVCIANSTSPKKLPSQTIVFLAVHHRELPTVDQCAAAQVLIAARKRLLVRDDPASGYSEFAPCIYNYIAKSPSDYERLESCSIIGEISIDRSFPISWYSSGFGFPNFEVERQIDWAVFDESEQPYEFPLRTFLEPPSVPLQWAEIITLVNHCHAATSELSQLKSTVGPTLDRFVANAEPSLYELTKKLSRTYGFSFSRMKELLVNMCHLGSGGSQCYSDEVERLANSARTLYFEKDLEQTLSAADRALETAGPVASPRSVNDAFRRALLFRAMALDALKRHEESLVAYDLAMALSPDDMALLYDRALCKGHMGDYEGAISDLSRCIEAQPNDASNYCQRGFVAIKIGRLDEAQQDYQKAAELAPGDARAFRQLGFIAMERQDYAAAVSSYDRAIAIDSERAIAFYNRALCKRHLKDHEGAFVDISRCIELEPDDPINHSEQGFNAMKIGRLEVAQQAYEKAAELNPNSAHYFRQLGYITLDRQLYDRAVEFFGRAVDIEPENTCGLYFRAKAYLKLDRVDEAKNDLRHAADLGDDDAVRLLESI